MLPTLPPLPIQLEKKLKELEVKFNGSQLDKIIGIAHKWYFQKPVDQDAPKRAVHHFEFDNVQEPGDSFKIGYAVPPVKYGMPFERGGGGVVYDLAYEVTEDPSVALEDLVNGLDDIPKMCYKNGEEVSMT